MEKIERKCIVCGGELRKLYRQSMPLAGLVQRDPRLDKSGLFIRDHFFCIQCGREECVISFPKDPFQTEEKTVTCPVCGKEHPANVGCPRCALQKGTERKRSVPPKKDSPWKKPPWEK